MAAVGLVFGGGAYAADTTGSMTSASSTTMTKAEYKAGQDRIEADYKSAKQRCDSMSDNAKDVCQKEAKGNEKVAKAELEAQYKHTDRARHNAAEAKADAQYEVAKEKCDDMKGNQKDVCVKDAKAAHEKAKADIAANTRTGAKTGAMGSTTSASDKREAREDATDAKYDAAKERCDSMSGDAKDRCVADAKMHYNK
jgi:hypothetical protein